MPTTAKSLVDAANAIVPKISGADAIDMVAKGDAVLIDIRDSAELAQTGKAAGSVHIPRGSLEFKADLTAPTAEKSLSFDKPVSGAAELRNTLAALSAKARALAS